MTDTLEKNKKETQKNLELRTYQWRIYYSLTMLQVRNREISNLRNIGGVRHKTNKLDRSI